MSANARSASSCQSPTSRCSHLTSAAVERPPVATSSLSVGTTAAYDRRPEASFAPLRREVPSGCGLCGSSRCQQPLQALAEIVGVRQRRVPARAGAVHAAGQPVGSLPSNGTTSTPSTRTVGDPMKPRIAASSSDSTQRSSIGSSARPSASKASRSRVRASSCDGHPDQTSSSTRHGDYFVRCSRNSLTASVKTRSIGFDAVDGADRCRVPHARHQPCGVGLVQGRERQQLVGDLESPGSPRSRRHRPASFRPGCRGRCGE